MTRRKHQSWADINRQIRGLEKELGMSHDDHQAFVLGVIGCDSLKGRPVKDMLAVRNALLDERAKARGGYQTSAKGHVRKLFALWGELKRQGKVTGDIREGLMAFVNAHGGTAYTVPDQLNWLTAEEANPLIERLKAWANKPAQDCVGEDPATCNNPSEEAIHA